MAQRSQGTHRRSQWKSRLQEQQAWGVAAQQLRKRKRRQDRKLAWLGEEDGLERRRHPCPMKTRHGRPVRKHLAWRWRATPLLGQGATRGIGKVSPLGCHIYGKRPSLGEG